MKRLFQKRFCSSLKGNYFARCTKFKEEIIILKKNRIVFEQILNEQSMKSPKLTIEITNSLFKFMNRQMQKEGYEMTNEHLEVFKKAIDRDSGMWYKLFYENLIVINTPKKTEFTPTFIMGKFFHSTFVQYIKPIFYKSVEEELNLKLKLNIDKSTSIGDLFRKNINDIASVFGGINARNHFYTTKPTSLGTVSSKFNAKIAFELLSKGPVDLTVPISITGSNIECYGSRQEGKTVYVFIAGPIQTTSDSKELTLTNTVLPGHLLGGTAKLHLEERDGEVIAYFKGEGYGNFAMLNEKFGTFIFENKMLEIKKYVINKSSDIKESKE